MNLCNPRKLASAGTWPLSTNYLGWPGTCGSTGMAYCTATKTTTITNRWWRRPIWKSNNSSNWAREHFYPRIGSICAIRGPCFPNLLWTNNGGWTPSGGPARHGNCTKTVCQITTWRGNALRTLLSEDHKLLPILSLAETGDRAPSFVHRAPCFYACTNSDGAMMPHQNPGATPVNGLTPLTARDSTFTRRLHTNIITYSIEDREHFQAGTSSRPIAAFPLKEPTLNHLFFSLSF